MIADSHEAAAQIETVIVRPVSGPEDAEYPAIISA
jgi:hypothetical protein